jgi:hypothetical protein
VQRYAVAPARICFAPKRPNPQHLARYVLADLFLDTFPYGAHTTASDAMWMGTPVLTFEGRGFAARVFAGLTLEEVAEAMDLSLSSVSRDWRFGRAFLAAQLSEDGCFFRADSKDAA